MILIFFLEQTLVLKINLLELKLLQNPATTVSFS